MSIVMYFRQRNIVNYDRWLNGNRLLKSRPNPGSIIQISLLRVEITIRLLDAHVFFGTKDILTIN